jgi:CheY-like chemotaxis protein
MSAVVLVVDDDDDVRQTAVVALEAKGYLVLEANCGAAALDMLRHCAAVIDVLFTDIVMPGMTGFELAALAKQLRPALRVLYTSGYLRDIPWGEHGIGHGKLIGKPWRPKDVASEIEALLA